MIGRIALVLLCLGLATAPAAAAADSTADADEGSCVWTSRDGTNVNAGVSPRECTSQGGEWQSSSSI